MALNEKQRKRRLRGAYTKVSLMALLLIVSTYAWFTSQKDITLANLKGTVEVAENMEISLDAKTWKQEIDLTDAVNVFAEAQASRDKIFNEENSTRKSTALAILPSQLLPVSAVGEIGSTLMPVYTGEATTISLTDIGLCLETDEDTGEVADNGYFAFDIYIKNTSEDGEDDVLQLNLNSAAQVLTQSIAKVYDGGNTIRTFIGDDASGLQNTVRVGLALYDGEVDSTSTQKEILESTYNATIQDIAIWEPNAKDHVEYIVTNNNKLVNGTDTDTDLSFDNGEEVATYALNEDSVGTDITNVYDITTTGLELQKTFKTDNIKDTTTGEVVDYRIKSEDEKPLDIKNIENADFKIASNKVSRLRVYVWLEGQDVDCINLASEGGGIELDLGLTKDNEVGDVLENANLPLNIEYEIADAANQEVKVTVRSTKELTLPDNTWNYEEIEQAAAGQVYQVASTEAVQLAATVINKKAMYKIFTGEAAANIEITSPDGSKNKLQFKIVYAEGSTTPTFAKVKYDKVVSTTGRVTATIDLGKEIATMPDGWYYSNDDKTEISKVYDENTTEDVEIEDEDGNTISVQIHIENIQMTSSPSGSFVTQVNSNKAANYGRKVNYPVDIDDSNGDGIADNPDDTDWLVFYSDENYVYLIADSYLPNSLINSTTLNELGLTTNGPYNVYWSNPSSLSYTIDSSSKFMISKAGNFDSSTDRYKATASLLAIDKWSSFLVNSTYAESAIGSPTIEMWMASWNTLYPDDLLYCNNVTSEGYQLGTSSIESQSFLHLYDYDGYTNKLYLPDNPWTLGYWIASPGVGSFGITELYGVANYSIGIDSFQSDFEYGGIEWGIRPVVCIKKEVNATLQGDVWVLEGTSYTETPEEGSLLTQVRDNKSANYGRYIDYPVDIDVTANTLDCDWQIFYTDENYVYIIADDYIPQDMINSSYLAELGMIKSNNYGTYGLYWDETKLNSYDIDSNNKYKISRADDFNSDNINYKVTGSLLDTTIWSEIFANNSYAVDAIGTPTVEMWMESWNTVYPEQLLYCDNVSTTGYYIGEETQSEEFYIDVSSYEGFTKPNLLYFPYTNNNESSDGSMGYWLASPTTNYEGGLLCIVSYYSAISSMACHDAGGYDHDSLGIRPVVCLEKGLNATLEGNKWIIEE